MGKRTVFLWLPVILMLLFGWNLTAQERREPQKKVIKLVEKAAADIKEKKIEKAAEKLAEAKALAPDYAPIYLQLALIGQHNQNLDEALEHMSRAYKLDPASDAVIHGYAEMLLRVAKKRMGERNMPGTLELYERFAAIPGIKARMTTQFVQVAYTLSGSYLQSNQPDRVIRHAEALLSTPGIESFPQQHLFSYFLLGSAYAQKEDSHKSVENLKKFLELNRDNLAPAQFVALANVLVAGSHFSRMEKEIEAMNREDLEGIRKTAESYQEMVKYLNDALTADPQNREAKFSLAKYQYYCQKHSEALKLLGELSAADPGNRDYRQVADIVSQALAAEKKKK